jgi:hypothetical protein
VVYFFWRKIRFVVDARTMPSRSNFGHVTKGLRSPQLGAITAIVVSGQLFNERTNAQLEKVLRKL